VANATAPSWLAPRERWIQTSTSRRIRSAGAGPMVSRPVSCDQDKGRQALHGTGTGTPGTCLGNITQN